MIDDAKIKEWREACEENRNETRNLYQQTRQMADFASVAEEALPALLDEVERLRSANGRALAILEAGPVRAHGFQLFHSMVHDAIVALKEDSHA